MNKDESERIAVLETKINDLIENHLKALWHEINLLRKKMDRFTWWLVLLLGGIIANLILQVIGKR